MLVASFWTAKWLWIFEVWQIPLIILLVALIIFWRRMRNRQV
ncbi:MAG: hypothetical protein ACYTF6_04170 [Planctomycetota bacterium]